MAHLIATYLATLMRSDKTALLTKEPDEWAFWYAAI